MVRRNRYEVDRGKIIFLKHFNLEMKFVVRLRWQDRQGRMEIRYEEAKGRGYVFTRGVTYPYF